MQESVLAVELSTEQVLEVNLPEQDNVAQIDVYWQDEVTLDLDLSLMYIVSGQREIQDYVDNKSKPEIDDYIETYAKPIVSEVVKETAVPVVGDYIENVTKPEIKEFADKEMAGYATVAITQAGIATEKANEASETAKIVDEKVQEFSQTTEASKTEFVNFAQEKTEEFEQTAITATEQAVGSAERSRIWAEGEQAEVQGLGGELSSMGAADLAYAIANAPEDTPIDASGLFAMNVVKGEKGDKGDKGEDGKDAEPFDAKGFLNLIYPVGSIYISTTTTCPIASYGVGTWELVGKDRVLQGAGTRGNVNTTINAGLPNITGNIGSVGNTNGTSVSSATNGAFSSSSNSKGAYSGGGGRSDSEQSTISFNASRSSSIYGKSTTVQPDAYLVNIFRRIS